MFWAYGAERGLRGGWDRMGHGPKTVKTSSCIFMYTVMSIFVIGLRTTATQKSVCACWRRRQCAHSQPLTQSAKWQSVDTIQNVNNCCNCESCKTAPICCEASLNAIQHRLPCLGCLQTTQFPAKPQLKCAQTNCRMFDQWNLESAENLTRQ